MLKRCAMLFCLATSGLAVAGEPVDLDMVSRIRQEAFHNSQVMATFSHLTEAIGPRLTNSPQMAEANAWTRGRFNAWGLANVHDEAFDGFGRGWEFSHASVQMLGPRTQPLHALPKAWTPGTDGPVEGEAVVVTVKKREDLDKYKGTLAGKVLLLSEAREYVRGEKADSHRHDDAGLAELQAFSVPKDEKDSRARRAKDTPSAPSWPGRPTNSSSPKVRWRRCRSAAGTTASSASAAAVRARPVNRPAFRRWPWRPSTTTRWSAPWSAATR
jgi:hypothetical protein